MKHQFQLIERADLNEEKWNRLVLASSASVYHQLYYLDTLSEQWCALVYDDYKGAIALPYTVRLGVKGLFTPNFIRSLSWMGERPTAFLEMEKIIKKQFKRASFHTDIPLFEGSSERVYQLIDQKEHFVIGSQTKRALKKFVNVGFFIQNEELTVGIELIVQELRNKVKDLREVDFERFKRLLLNYTTSPINCWTAEKNGTIHASLVVIEWNNEVLYIKGGVDEFGKKNGAMHGLMHYVIQTSLEKNKVFSFEGSAIDSVRQFNCGFGAFDTVYYAKKWDNSPWWFKLLMKLKK
jgi:hypothetical protein